MKKNYALTYLLLWLTVFSGFAQTAKEETDLAVINKIKEEGLNNSKVMETAFYLTDVSGPRLSNSPGLKKASEWAQKTLTQWSLVNAKLEPWGEFGRGWEIEKSYLAVTAPYYFPVIAAPKAWTPGTNGLVKANVTLVNATKDEDLAQYAGKLKGQVIITPLAAPMKTSFEADARRYTEEDLGKMLAPVATRNAPTAADADYEKRLAEYRARLTFRAKLTEFLQQEGASLVLSYRSGTHGTFFTSNGASYAANAKPVLPEFEIAGEDYGRILRLAEAKIPVTLEFESKTRFVDADLKGYNVVAEIPGTDRKLKSELVMLGGHIDSWHAATGATDNAAGVAVMMEAVRILKAINAKPKRTIRIALWSGEEQGIHGSRGYVKNHFADPATMELKPEHEKVSAYFNLDNGTGKIRGIYTQGNEVLNPIFTQWLEPFKELGATTVTNRNTGGTDHLSFDAVGIPGFQFVQDPIEYGTRTHHSNQDTYERLQPDDLKQASVIVAAFVYNTAMRKDKLPRKPLPKKKAA
jgi:carboxypeptidase Q